MKEEMKKVENVLRVFIVVRRKARIVRPEKFWLNDYRTNILAVFENRKNAQEWIDYFEIKDFYDILERKLT